MHESVRENLETLLRGSGKRPLPADTQEHLAACAPCRSTVEQMREQSALLVSLRAPGEMEPPTGFYARVMARVEAQARPSAWSFFLDPFGKRLSYAAATLLLLLGTYIYTSEWSEYEAASSPEALLVDHEVRPTLGVDQQQDRDTLLVNLASYEDTSSYQ